MRGRLRAMPPFITDGLRACQIDAVSALEASMAQNRPRALVQMATGAGKTFTACTLSYRLLAHAGFKRILFLADRANLVRQTRDEYLAYRPPGTGRSFSEIYNVQKLGAAGLDKDAQVVIATIQRVYSVLTGKELSEEEEEASSFESVAGRRPSASFPTIRRSRSRASTSSSPMNATARSTAPGGRCWNISMPSSSASPRRPRCTRWASSARTSSRNIPMSVRSSTASMSVSRSSASAPRSASAAQR